MGNFEYNQINIVPIEKMNKQGAMKYTFSILIFVLGIAISRYGLIAYQENKNIKSKSSSELIETVQIFVNDPKVKLKETLTEIVLSKTSYSVKQTKYGYELILKDLVPYSPDQEEVKKSLGVGNASSGNVIFEIHKKTQ